MYKDSRILSELRKESEKAYSTIYDAYYNMISRFVLRNSGTAEDADDVFQDVMVVLVEKLRQDDFVLTASLKTYVFAIAKNIWFKKLRNAAHEVPMIDGSEHLFYEEVSMSIERESTYRDKLLGYLNKITSHCSRLLRDMFFRNKTVDEIQLEYGYSSRHNTQNQKYKCIQQVRRVKENASH